jgi:hypothetical protein
VSYINNFFKQEIIKLSAFEEPFLRQTIKRAAYLSGIGIDSKESFYRFTLAKSHCNKLNLKMSDHDLVTISNSCIDDDEVLYKIVKSQIINSNLKKIAYPNPGLSPDFIKEEVDLNKWIDAARGIYVDCKYNGVSLEKAIEDYSNTLPKEDRFNFLNWIKIYLSGDKTKYSNEEGIRMKKESVFQSDLGQGNNPYAHDGSGFYFQNRNLGNNMPGDSFSAGTGIPSTGDALKPTSQKMQPNSPERRKKLKKDLHAACRRIDKVIREEGFCTEEEYVQIAKLLLELSMLIKKVKLASTVNDLTYRYAKKIEKIGHKRYADSLIKFAQDAEAPPVQPDVTPDLPAEEAQAAPEAEQPAGPSDQERKSGVSIPEPDNVEPTKLRDIEPIPGAQPGEYEMLAGNINLEDAAKKLDEVAGMLADRRIIRQLAEFDIMLDKIGIASMFPELAESQSKLIDAFSYALTRVTKMMGQLSNAKSLLEAGGAGIPGASSDQSAAETPPEESDAEVPQPQPPGIDENPV